jgi:hypothetical protein
MMDRRHCARPRLPAGMEPALEASAQAPSVRGGDVCAGAGRPPSGDGLRTTEGRSGRAHVGWLCSCRAEAERGDAVQLEVPSSPRILSMPGHPRPPASLRWGLLRLHPGVLLGCREAADG